MRTLPILLMLLASLTLASGDGVDYMSVLSTYVKELSQLETDWRQRVVRDTREYVRYYFTADEKHRLESVHSILRQSRVGSAGVGWTWLADFADKFGHRMVGSKALEKTIEYVSNNLQESGFSKAYTEDVHDLPNWKRGREKASIVSPIYKKMNILSTGNSPGGSVEASVVVFHSLEEFDAAPNSTIHNKIVLFNYEWTGYHNVYMYRKTAPRVVAKGGLAVLIRSLASVSINSPHTGSSEPTSIPSVCITVEDADYITRLSKGGKNVRVSLDISNEYLGNNASSKNVIFELTGSERPEEIVLIGGHIDSWDVGQGAMDNGGGMAAVYQAMTVLKKLGFQPKRTIRAVFFTAEEECYCGSIEYERRHRDENIIFVAETDMGAFRPTSFNAIMEFAGGSEKQQTALNKTLTLLHLNALPLSSSVEEPTGDIAQWTKRGIPGIYYKNMDTYDKYFYFHHTRADMMTILTEEDIDDVAAVFASIAFDVAQNGI